MKALSIILACIFIFLASCSLVVHQNFRLAGIFIFLSFLVLLFMDKEVRYKDGDPITGKEKVIRTEIIGGVTCHFISMLCFKVSTEDLVLLQNNLEAIHVFKSPGFIKESIVKEWPKAKKLPKWIYFCKKTFSSSSMTTIEKHNREIISAVELNVLVAFNTAYPDFYKHFPNGIQRTDQKENFCRALFEPWRNKITVRVDEFSNGAFDVLWLAGTVG